MVYKSLTPDRREWRKSANGPAFALLRVMFSKIARLFVIKTRLEAFAIIYALAVGAVTRGFVYLHNYPGFGGYLLFAACTGAVFMAGGKLLDATRGPHHRRSSLRRVVMRARTYG
jgi:hypothetical protein